MAGEPWNPWRPSGTVLELLAQVGGVVPTDQARWMPSTDPSEVIADCVMDLDRVGRREFLAAWTGGGWSTVLVCSDRHPSLADLVLWVESHDDVLLLAAPSGPEPPAVAAFTRASASG